MIDKRLVSQISDCLKNEPKIKLAYVLGSSVKERARKDSDFDLAVVLDHKDEAEYEHFYNLLSKINLPKDLDLSLVDKNSSPLFLFQIVDTGVCVYQTSDQERISFAAFVLRNYYDNAHIRNIYYSYLKQKFSYANQ